MKIFSKKTAVIIALLFSGAIALFCQYHSRDVEYFKNTEAYELAKAVDNEDLPNIERLVKANPKSMEFADPIYGSNVVGMSILLEKYQSFKKLLELGANPNYISSGDSSNLLIYSCKMQNGNKIDTNYLATLLNYGADPNYVIKNSFWQGKQLHLANSALSEASKRSLAMVKILIAHGANPYQTLEKYGNNLNSAIYSRNFDIINYYLDSFNFDVHKPVSIRSNNDTLYIQDLAKLYLFTENVDPEQRDSVIKKLELRGVDFKNYKYKVKWGDE